MFQFTEHLADRSSGQDVRLWISRHGFDPWVSLHPVDTWTTAYPPTAVRTLRRIFFSVGHVNSKKKPCWRTPSQHMLEFFIFRVGVVTGHKQASVKNRVGFDSTQHEMLKIPTRFFFRVGGPNTVCHTPSQKIPNLSFLNCHHPFSPKKLCSKRAKTVLKKRCSTCHKISCFFKTKFCF